MRCTAWLAALAITACASAEELRPSLLAVSSGEHLWVAQLHSGQWQILHHAIQGEDGASCEAAVLPEPPQLLAASGSQLWIVMPPKGGATSVYSLAAKRNPATSLWYFAPPGRLDVLPSPPGGSLLTSIAGIVDGPVAVVRDPAQSGSRLLRLGVMAWSQLLLPEGVADDPIVFASRSSPCGWAMLAQEPGAITWWVPADAGNSTDSQGAANWKGTRIGVAPGTEVTAISGAGSDAVLLRDGSGQFELGYLSPGGIRQLCKVSPQDGPWAMVGAGDGFAIVTADPDGSLSVSRVDGTSGKTGDPHLLVAQEPSTGDWIHLPLLGAMTIGLLLAGFILRPPLEPTRPMPQGWQPLPMGRRTIALLIDMTPGICVATFLMDASPADLIAMPSWTPDFAQASTASVMLGVTMLWCLAFEVALRASPGKLIVGARVIASEATAATGDIRAGAPRAALRALLKGAVLFAPALGFFAFVHPLLQGLPETLTRTAVARRIG